MNKEEIMELSTSGLNTEIAHFLGDRLLQDYSGDIAAAWPLLESAGLGIERQRDGAWVCYGYVSGYPGLSGDTAPQAIARTFLWLWSDQIVNDNKAPADNKKYAGKFVFVQEENGSGYNDGEYFVIRDGVGCFYGIRPIAGYGGSHTKRIDVLPGAKSKYIVLEGKEDWWRASELEHDLKYFSETIKRGEKPDFIERVYTEAANNARAIHEIMVQRSVEIMSKVVAFTSDSFNAL